MNKRRFQKSQKVVYTSKKVMHETKFSNYVTFFGAWTDNIICLNWFSNLHKKVLVNMLVKVGDGRDLKNENITYIFYLNSASCWSNKRSNPHTTKKDLLDHLYSQDSG